MIYYDGENPFCPICGERTVDEETNRFCPATGERYYRRICPKHPCGHTGHDWEALDVSVFAVLMARPDKKCRRCGAKGHISVD